MPRCSTFVTDIRVPDVQFFISAPENNTMQQAPQFSEDDLKFIESCKVDKFPSVKELREIARKKTVDDIMNAITAGVLQGKTRIEIPTLAGTMDPVIGHIFAQYKLELQDGLNANEYYYVVKLE